MMYRDFFKLILLVTAFAVSGLSFAGKKERDFMPHIEARINGKQAVVGERLIYEVVLHTPDPSLAGFDLVRNPDFKGLPVSRSAADTHLQESEYDGQDMYSVVIDRFFVAPDHKGKYRIGGGMYKVGYNRKVQVNDPFWGPYIADKVEVIELESPDVTLNVKDLPVKGRPDNFSGAVGDFQVSVVIPDQPIVAGKEAYAIVSVSGIGDLTDAALPDVRNMFGGVLQFRSMTDSRNHYIAKGSLGSEIEMECVFVPREDGEFFIESCGFSYFNPQSFRYETAYSDPVKVVVGERSKSRTDDSPPVYMDI